MSNKLPQKMISGFPVSVLQLMDTGFYDSGFSNTTIRIMYEIYNNLGCTASSIAKTLKVHRTLVGRNIVNLEKEQYLTRTQCPDDERKLILHLTDKGKTYIETQMKDSSDAVAKKIASLNGIDRNKLMEAFSTIQTILK
ncbi:MAG: MarR family transcriptional regulator [Clostridia bacterium]|nr:MarR family transcriptional regulator [Clostridia bacterium]